MFGVKCKAGLKVPLTPVPYRTATLPFGTVISNRVPLPGSPVSVMGIPVIDRISRVRNSPGPVPAPC